MAERLRIVVGITGASGTILGVRVLEALRRLGVETHLVVSAAGAVTMALETRMKLAALRALAHRWYRADDIAAPIASGSFKTAGMIVAPCSTRTVGELASGNTAGLLTRAADVTLKERRRLVLLLRESPLHTGHLRNLVALSEMGAIVAPPVPAFYNAPRSVDDIVDHAVGRALDLFGLDTGAVRRWGGAAGRGPSRAKGKG